MEGFRFKLALLMCLVAAALYTGVEAWQALRPARENKLPQEVYARFLARADSAEYYLKNSGDYVAVYDDRRAREPVSVTGIELDSLRGADRAMVEEGIPVIDRKELLLLLEDLGS